jgi:protein-arginine deiminase
MQRPTRPPLARAASLLGCIWILGCSSGPAASDAITEGGPPGENPVRVDLKPDIDPLAPIVDIRADVNRNGTVDLTDPSEDLDEETWDAKHGAIFLANIDDDKGTCPKTGTDVALIACNDAADDVVNGTDDELDLAPLKIAAWPTAPDGTVGNISLTPAAKPYVRLFKKQGHSYTVLNPDSDTLSVAELRSGVELAIEGKDVVRDAAVWDGFVDVTFSVKTPSSATPLTDKVRMRLAPMITQHHLSAPQTLFATSFAGDPESTVMINDLTAGMTAAGLSPMVKLAINDQWTQDLWEVTYTSMPAVGGPHVIYLYVRSANVENPKSTTNPLRSGGKVLFTFRGKDIGVVQQYDVKHSSDMDTLNSFGNLETVPPYTYNGQTYPLGRQFRGTASTFYPDPTVTKMFESQKVQPPVYIDTSWLLVGHVDETIAFVKAPTARGWTIAVNDPTLAKTMLQQASAGGNGAAKVFEGLKWLNDFGAEYSAETTIDGILADTAVMSQSATAAVEVANQIDTLKKETGITDAEILHLPFLHWSVDNFAVAYQVGTVNGISLGDAHYAAAEPHGPVINHKDIFKAQMETEFAKVGVTVHWVEDWDLYHRLDGEIHCGTNTTRQVPTTGHWWESGR